MKELFKKIMKNLRIEHNPKKKDFMPTEIGSVFMALPSKEVRIIQDLLEQTQHWQRVGLKDLEDSHWQIISDKCLEFKNRPNTRLDKDLINS